MKHKKSGWREFLGLCQTFSSVDELDEFFSLFMTFEERENLADRYLIIRELLLGEKTQREIAEDLNVSIAKITRGSNELKTKDAALKASLLEDFKKAKVEYVD